MYISKSVRWKLNVEEIVIWFLPSLHGSTRCVLNYKLSQPEVHLYRDAGYRCLARFSRQFHYHCSRIRSHSITRAAYQSCRSYSGLAQINLAPGEGDKTHRRVPLICSRRDRSRSISHCDSPPATTPDKSVESETGESLGRFLFFVERPITRVSHEVPSKFVFCLQFSVLQLVVRVSNDEWRSYSERI